MVTLPQFDPEALASAKRRRLEAEGAGGAVPAPPPQRPPPQLPPEVLALLPPQPVAPHMMFPAPAVTMAPHTFAPTVVPIFAPSVSPTFAPCVSSAFAPAAATGDGDLNAMLMESLRSLGSQESVEIISVVTGVKQELKQEVKDEAVASSAGSQQGVAASGFQHPANLMAVAAANAGPPRDPRVRDPRLRVDKKPVVKEEPGLMQVKEEPGLPVQKRVKREPGFIPVKQETGVKQEPGVKQEVKEEDLFDLPKPAFKFPPPDTDIFNGTAGQLSDSDEEGKPHRLPPGFGAVPEDLIEERARQREEERMRRLKATQPCRFGRQCKRRDCPNMHQEGREIDTVLNPCMFGKRCKRANCFYDHLEGRDIDLDQSKGMCKFGVRCRRPDCLYNHPPGREAVSGADLRICYFCHGTGHIAQDCPRNPDSWAYNREAAEAQALVVRAAVMSAAKAGAAASSAAGESSTAAAKA